MNRQQFLKLIASTLPGLSGCAKPDPGGTAGGKRVVVIGAGLAGLAAASKLQSHGHEVLVIEARDRIGGRIWTSNQWDDSPLDLGASWIHGVLKNPLTGLADQIDAQRVVTRYENSVTYDTGGMPLNSDQTKRMERLHAQLSRAIDQAKGRSDDIPIRQAIHPVIEQFEQGSEGRRFANFIVNSEFEQEYSGSAAKLSTLWFDNDDEFGGDDVLFARGLGVIPQYLAQGLNLKLGQIVDLIEWGTSPVRIVTQDSEFEADHVLVTVPLGVLQSGKVTFRPPLPGKKKAAISTIGMGLLNKCYLRFREPFWPQDLDWLEYIPAVPGRWAEWLSLARVTQQPVLLGFNAADQGREIEELSDADTVSDAMQTLNTIFGEQIPAPIDFQITRWAKDPFALGSYSYNAVGWSPGVRSTLADPLEHQVFFAGEATHRSYFGTAHGAYLSGLDAAQQILEA